MAYVTHNNGLRVVEATTKEFNIARHLYKTNDISAAFNVGIVLGERLKELGILRVMWQISKKEKGSEKVRDSLRTAHGLKIKAEK